MVTTSVGLCETVRDRGIVLRLLRLGIWIQETLDIEQSDHKLEPGVDLSNIAMSITWHRPHP